MAIAKETFNVARGVGEAALERAKRLPETVSALPGKVSTLPQTVGSLPKTIGSFGRSLPQTAEQFVKHSVEIGSKAADRSRSAIKDAPAKARKLYEELQERGEEVVGKLRNAPAKKKPAAKKTTKPRTRKPAAPKAAAPAPEAAAEPVQVTLDGAAQVAGE